MGYTLGLFRVRVAVASSRQIALRNPGGVGVVRVRKRDRNEIESQVEETMVR